MADSQGGEAHLDAESSGRPGVSADHRFMCLGYGGDDGQAQAGSAGFTRAFGLSRWNG